MKSNSLPYENATSGKRATQEMDRTLKAFGASSFGCMENFDKGEVIVQFEWRGHRVMIPASGKGYAAVWLRRHPYNSRMRITKIEYERRALQIGQTAVWSMLRDWIKGQIAAVETGILSFEGAFLGQIMLPDGRTVLDRVTQDNLLSLPYAGPKAFSGRSRGAMTEVEVP
jgi:hypothetical protein